MQSLRKSLKIFSNFRLGNAALINNKNLLKNILYPTSSISYTFPTYKFSSKQTIDPAQAGLEEVEKALKQIKLENGKDITQSGYIMSIEVGHSGTVTVILKLDQNYRKIKTLIQEGLISIPWIKNLDIKMAPKEQESKFEKRGGLKDVKKIIAVSSCKGGVGKSTIAINLAFSLKKLGKKVGIFDADIYGPSLPTLIAKQNAILESPEDKPKEIIPIEYEGLLAMSFGFANRGKKAVMRGPMVSSVVNQLVYQTQWGDLDYLVVDMPPGTGDIQITLGQELKFDGAVIVTTPQALSFVDVVKGIEMFDDLKVPTVAVVENMSLFNCEKCGHEHHLFGPGYLSMLKSQFGIKHSTALPIYSSIAKYSDAGAPVALTLPEEHTIVKIFNDLAMNVHKEIEHIANDNQPPHVRYDTQSTCVIVRTVDGKEKKIKALELRKRCNCALCIDEFTGKKLLKDDSIREDVFPAKIEPKGNYAVAVVWSDGHKSSIYPYERLLSEKIPEHVRQSKN